MKKEKPVKLVFSPSEGGVRSIVCNSKSQAIAFVKNMGIGWHRIDRRCPE